MNGTGGGDDGEDVVMQMVWRWIGGELVKGFREEQSSSLLEVENSRKGV